MSHEPLNLLDGSPGPDEQPRGEVSQQVGVRDGLDPGSCRGGPDGLVHGALGHDALVTARREDAAVVGLQLTLDSLRGDARHGRSGGGCPGFGVHDRSGDGCALLASTAHDLLR